MKTRLNEYQGLNISFNVTENCNLRCTYCYELDKQPLDLSLDYAKRFIDVLLSDPDPIGAVGTESAWILDNGLVMDLIGGDALMRPQLCRGILNYWMFNSVGHKWSTRWRVSISTNGTLFESNGVKDFLEQFKHNVSMGVSIDGCPEIHDLNRPGSMKLILKNWDWYVGFCGRAGTSPTTKATLNKQSIPYLYKSLKFLHGEMGLQQIAMNFVFEDLKLTDDDLKLFDNQMEKCVDYVLQHSDVYWGMLDPMLKSDTPDLEGSWCGSGAMPALSVNGKIYPCFRFLPHTMSSRDLDFHVGDVWNGFDHKERFTLVRSQKRSKISTRECLECKSQGGCAWCIGGAFSEKGEFYRQTYICEVHKIQEKWTKEYWNTLTESGRKDGEAH